MISRPAPEFDLLCLAAQPASCGDAQALRRAVSAIKDWPAVIQGAQRNHVTPLLLASLSDGAVQVPQDVLDELRRRTTSAAGRSLRQIPALESLCAVLERANIRYLVLKGIPLSLRLYGDPARRMADDFDVLVSPAQFWQADAALVQAGYRYETEPPAAARSDAYTNWVKDLRYVDERSGTVVELHHRLTANPYLLEWDFDELWRDRDRVRLRATEVPALAAARVGMYVFVHGANHGWERLRWLVDFAAVLEREDGVERLLGEAERAGLRPAMLQALSLAHARLALPLPPRLLDEAAKDRKVRRLDYCLSRFAGPTGWRRRPRPRSWGWFWRFSIWFFAYGLLLKPDWRYRAHHIATLWVHPPDWDIIRLPPSLSWLYPAIRPLGWAVRRLRS